MWSGRPFSFAPQKGERLIIRDVRSGNVKIRVADDWYGFTFSHNGKLLATWTLEEISLWDLDSGNHLATLIHKGVSKVQFVRNADLLITETTNSSGYQWIPSELLLWSTKNWQRVETKIDSKMPLLSPIVSPDGKYLAGFESVPGDGENKAGQLKLWEIKTGRNLPAPEEISKPYGASLHALYPFVGFRHDSKALCFPSKNFWDIESATLKPVSESFDFFLDADLPRKFRYLNPNQDAKKMRVKVIDDNVMIWGDAEGKLVSKFNTPIPLLPVNEIQQAQLEGRVGVFDGALTVRRKDHGSTVDIWDTANWEISRSIKLVKPNLRLDGGQWIMDKKLPLVRVSRDCKTVVVLEAVTNLQNRDRACSVKAYDLDTGELKYTLKGHNDFVSSVYISHDSRLIATASGGGRFAARGRGEVKLWDASTGRFVRTIIDQSYGVSCLAFNSRDDLLAIARQNHERTITHEIILQRTSTGEVVSKLELPQLNGPSSRMEEPYSLAFSPDDKLIAVGGAKHLTLWNLPSGEFRHSVRSGPIQSLQFSSDGKSLYLSGSGLYEALVAELGNQTDLRKALRKVNNLPNNLPIDGDFSISKYSRGEISVWDIKTGKLHKVIPHYGVRSVQLTSKGQMVTGSVLPETFITTVLDPETGQVLMRLRHLDFLHFSSEGAVFATKMRMPRSAKLAPDTPGGMRVNRNSFIAGIVLKNTRTGKKLAELAHESCERIDFSPDGKFLLSTGPDNTKLWDVRDLIRDSVD